MEAYGNYNTQVLQVAFQRNQSVTLWDFECVLFISIRSKRINLDFHILAREMTRDRLLLKAKLLTIVLLLSIQVTF